MCIRVIEKTLDKGESKLEKSLYQKLIRKPCHVRTIFLTRTSAHWSIGPNRSSRCSAVQCNAEYVNIHLGESALHMLYAVTDHYLYTYLFTYPSLDYFFLDGVEVCSTRPKKKMMMMMMKSIYLTLRSHYSFDRCSRGYSFIYSFDLLTYSNTNMLFCSTSISIENKFSQNVDTLLFYLQLEKKKMTARSRSRFF